MSETNTKKHRIRDFAKAILMLALGIVIGFLFKDAISVGANAIQKPSVAEKDYDIEEMEVDYLQMLEGVKGVTFDVVNGIRCVCKCDDAHPEGDLLFYRFKGYIGDEASKKVQKLQFDYVVKPVVANGQLSFSNGDVSRVMLDPEDVVVNNDGMKRLLNAFAAPQLKPFALYAPNGAFAVKELYSNMAVIKVSKEK